MTDGRRFKDFAEFRALLLADRDRFTRCLAEKLLAFATGKEPGPADRSDVNRIVADVAAHGSGFRELIHAVVQSDLFRNK